MTNLDIAQSATLREIGGVADAFGLQAPDYEPLGRYKGKLTYEGMSRLRANPKKGKLILVTAINPTPAGEGKTTVTVGLTQGLNRIGAKAISATREPALGPIFGVKGGACGGGYSQVLPMEDINLFFNGDFPAISAAHNLLSALLDAHLNHGNALQIDARENLWPRTVDCNDRALRQILVGLGGRTNGPTREDGFVITPASEVMAILCLSRDIADLKERLGRIVVGVGPGRKPITAAELQGVGSMAALLRDAIRPNLVQTMEGGLAFVHGGPFGNIAHGCSSIVATECALGLSDFVVTEAGFGSDLGAEKFLDIVCPRLGHGPDAIVLVATIRALKHHGGGDLTIGSQNLVRHVRHLSHYGPPVIVAINRFADDTEEEHCELLHLCEVEGVPAVSANPWGAGGAGCEELAHEVLNRSAEKSAFQTLYQAEDSLEAKLTNVVRKAYGGAGVSLTEGARKQATWLQKHGYGNLPVCVAKTQYSLSDDPTRINAPTGFDVHVREIRLSAGAGFLVAVSGDILLMPGLGKAPSAFTIDVDEEGKIKGLF